MRSYKADLSRRLGPVFAEQAAQPKTTSTRNLPAHEEVCLTKRPLKFYVVTKGRVSAATPAIAAATPAIAAATPAIAAATPAIAAAYKPTHGGYPSAGARA